MLEVRNLRKSFGGVTAISDVTLDFPDGSLTAIIGPNGAGKSTFFNLISGGLVPDSGSVTLGGRNLVGASRAEFIKAGIGRAFQIAKIFPSLTVEETLLGAIGAHQGHSANLWQRFPLARTHEKIGHVAGMLGLADKL
ncbi:MAG: ATP-binding cassette domain-containing protein, partial [Hyphomicrobiales bacterium]